HLQINATVLRRRREKAAGQSIGFIKECGTQHAYRSSKIDVIEHISAHSSKGQRILFGSGLPHKGRTSAAATQASRPQTAAGAARATTAAASAGGGPPPLFPPFDLPSTLGPIPMDLLMRRFRLT